MTTKFLFKHFLTLSLFVLLLLSQVSGISTAFAAGIQDVPENQNCLNVSLSTVFSDGVVAVTSPPGQGVTFAVSLYATNNCKTTVMSGTIISGTVNVTCPDGSSKPSPSTPVTYTVPDPIVPSHTEGAKGTGQAYCIVVTNGVQTSSVVPASVSIDVTANGTDGNGQPVQAGAVTLPVNWTH